MKRIRSQANGLPAARVAWAPLAALTAVALGILLLFAPAPANAWATNLAAAQQTFTGTWTASVNRDGADDRLNFNIRRRDEDGESNMGHDFAFSDFQGLSRDQVMASTDTRVTFRLVREAGTIECEGSFRAGRGAGSWRLSPNASFRGAMAARGYELSDREMLTAAMIDVTTKAVDDLKAVGFENLSYEDVVKGVIFKITPQFAAEMKSLGFGAMGLEDLVKARIFKIDGAFVREARAMGFESQSMEELVKLRIFKVTPEFLAEVKAEGLSDISIEEAVKLRIFKIDGDFIRQARASGRTDLDVEDLVRMRIHGKNR
jgi:hypothetical protein